MSHFEQPTVLLEIRTGQQDVAETRQGAIGHGLEANGILPVYVDVGDRNFFTPDMRAIRNFQVLDPREPGRLVRSVIDHAIVPDVYRLRDVPTLHRPNFTRQIPGYNSEILCDAALGRLSMELMLDSLGLSDYIPQTELTTTQGLQATLQELEGDMLFVKPWENGDYSDVGGDKEGHTRRARYVHRDTIAQLLTAKFGGVASVQPDVAAPAHEIMERLDIDPTTIADSEQRKHHTLRVYHMMGAGEQPDVAEVRFLKPDDIGRPEPSHYELYEPEQLFAALPEIQVLHSLVSQRIGEQFGLNYCAADYFIGKDGEPKITYVHVRPWLPSIKNDDLSKRTVETEVRTLTRLATQDS